MADSTEAATQKKFPLHLLRESASDQARARWLGSKDARTRCRAGCVLPGRRVRVIVNGEDLAYAQPPTLPFLAKVAHR